MQRVVFVVPDFATTESGIARHCRAVALALSELCVSRHLFLRVHSLCDSAGAEDRRYVPAPTEYYAYDNDRLRFSAAVLRGAWHPQTVATIFGHVNFAPLSFGFPPKAPYAVFLYG